MEPLIKEGGRSLPQTVMTMNNFDCNDNDNRNINCKQKQEEKGTFIDFKNLESPSDDDFDIDRNPSLHLMNAAKQLNAY